MFCLFVKSEAPPITEDFSFWKRGFNGKREKSLLDCKELSHYASALFSMQKTKYKGKKEMLTQLGNSRH